MLPNVTLIIIDSLNTGRAEYAVNRCLEHAEFKKVVKLYDQNINSIQAYNKFVLKELHRFFTTDFCLIIQHDGFIVNPKAWNDEFLNYDYIGAPWWYHDGYNVGNGGFSLRSKKLQLALQDNHILTTEAEDGSIGRIYRDYLVMNYNIKFAPEALASKFSWEYSRTKYPVYNNAFGFHGMHGIHNFFQRILPL